MGGRTKPLKIGGGVGYRDISMKESAGVAKARRAFGLFGFLLVVWSFYRLIFRLPENVEELFIKPAVWLGAVGYLLVKEKRGLASLGWENKNIGKSLYLGTVLGGTFAIAGLAVGKDLYVNLDYRLGMALLTTLFTAISEETVFRGYILRRFLEVGGNKWLAVAISTVAYSLIHLPVWILMMGRTGGEVAVQVAVLAAFGVGAGLVAVLSKSVAGAALGHWIFGFAVGYLR